MRDITVVVTGAGTTTALSAIKGLRDQRKVSVRIVSVDMNPESVGRYFSDAFYTVPRANSPDFVESLLEICRLEDARLLIPIVDYEFLPLSLAKERFGSQGCRVAISSETTIRICNQKDLTHFHFAEHGIPSPALYDADTVLHHPESAALPLIIKPRLDGRGSIDVYKLETVEDLQYWGRRVHDPLFEECVEGREFTIDTLSDFDGRVVASVPRERLEVKAGICYKGRTTHEFDLVAWGVRVATSLGIVGPANIQCRVTAQGQVRFFEVNPRFGATLPITTAAGVNMPLLLLQMTLGAHVDERLGDFAEISMLRFWDEVFVPTAELGGATVVLPSQQMVGL
jgi:carbamoyl-phosphate synthase large subunit